MIRTKDLFLFVVVLVFLTLAIVFTLAREPGSSFEQLTDFVSDKPPIRPGEYEDTELDRTSIIERLRLAIAGEEIIEAPMPVVEESAATTTAKELATSEVILQKCATQTDALNFAREWPRDGVTIGMVEGVRRVAVVREDGATQPTTPSSSTSVPVVTESTVAMQPLLQLPFVPDKSGPHCLASEIIGVTTDGTLMFNSDAIAYYRRGSNELIGYARDGVPIYGSYSGETDECGGYESGGTYRYAISTERNFILGCYQASPQRFVGE